MREPKSYAYVIERAEDGSFWGYLPDLPGCATSASSAELAEAQLPEAIGIYLSYFYDRGLPPPSPEAKVGVFTAT